jgi:phasin family protein
LAVESASDHSTADCKENKMPKETKSHAEKNGPGETFDFTKLLGQYNLPGVDFAALVERERKNIEALTKANRIAFEGWQALVRRQSEILVETMEQTIVNARKEGAAKNRVELATQGFEKALENMRELAEMAAKSQKESFEVLRRRIGENMDEIKAIGKYK